MKKILLIILIVVSGVSYGQGVGVAPKYRLAYADGNLVTMRVLPPIPGYTQINGRYKYLATAVDSGLHIPQYNGTPSGVRGGVWVADGAIGMDTLNNRFYIYSGGAWIRVANYSDIAASTPTLQQVTTAGSTTTTDITMTGGATNYLWNYNSTYLSLLHKQGLSFAHVSPVTGGYVSQGIAWNQNASFPGGSWDTVVNSMGSHIETNNYHFFLADQVAAVPAGYPGIAPNTLVTIEQAGTNYVAFYINPNNNKAQMLVGVPGEYGAISDFHRYRFVSGGSSGFADTAYFKGNVGIGIQAPTSKLHVVDNVVTTGIGAAFSSTSLSSGSLVDISVNSTAAVSNTQKGLNVNLSGANSTSSQITYGTYSANNHSGTGAVNYGSYSTAINGAVNYGVYGNGSSIGVWGNSSGVGVTAQTTTGIGLNVISADGVPIGINAGFTNANGVQELISSVRTTTGTASSGIGQFWGLYNENDNGTNILSNKIISKLTTVTNGAEVSQFDITGVNSGTSQTQFSLLGTGQLQLPQYTTSNFNGGVAADSVLVVTSTGVVKKRDAAAFGGGGSGITVGTTTITSGTSGNIPYNAAGVYQEDNAIFRVGTGVIQSNKYKSPSATYSADGTNAQLFSDQSNQGIQFRSDATKDITFFSGQAYTTFAMNATAFLMGSEQITWNGGSGAYAAGGNVGLTWKSSGVLKVSDASTGYGGLVAAHISANQGADVASANNLSVIANATEITGATQINLISNSGWVNGSVIRLIFTTTPTVKHAQTTSGSNITILLAGAVDFSATADDILTLMLCEVGGTQAWREVSRSIN